jgi:sugar lactone lactonase YvrE
MVGDAAIFTVIANGTTPLTYQWKKDGAPLADSGNISGATTAALTLSNLVTGDAGQYTVTVSNAAGSVEATATLTVTLTAIVPPTITQQPVSQTKAVGGTATFAVTAAGTAPLTYQWKKDGAPLANGGNISGATAATLTLTGLVVGDAGQYTVTVSNAAGSVEATATLTVTLTAIVPPTITQPPVSQTKAVGGTATFAVTAAGTTPLTYQWKKDGAPLANGGNISGATTAALTLSALALGDAGEYTVTVSNSAGSVEATAALTVVIPPPSPVVTGISPLNAHPGDIVTITGQNLAGATVTVGGVPVLITSNTGTTITIVVPAGTAGGVISVTTAGGSSSSAQPITVTPDIGTGGLLAAPSGVVVAAGSPLKIYVADTTRHTVSVIESGTLRVLAGQSGVAGTLDGTGSAARFRSPRGLTINRAGQLLVADSGNHRLRAVTATGAAAGLVTTTGTAGLDATLAAPADAAARDAASGESYIADTGNHLIKKINATGSVSIVAGGGVPGTANGTLLAARFNAPAGVAVDVSGSYLYVADTGNHAIRLIDLGGGEVSTFAGQMAVSGYADGGALAAARFNAPGDLIVDGAGDVYVADTGNSRIRLVTVTGGTRTVGTLAGGASGFVDGDGTIARFNRPAALTLAGDRSLYVADTGNGAIRRIAPDLPATVSTIQLQAGPPVSTGTTSGTGGTGDNGTGGNGNNGGGGNNGGNGGGGGGAPTLPGLALLAALGVLRAWRGWKRRGVA